MLYLFGMHRFYSRRDIPVQKIKVEKPVLKLSFRKIDNYVMCCMSTDREGFRLLLGILLVKIPSCDPKILPFILWGSQPVLSILN